MKHNAKRLFALSLAVVMVCVIFIVPALAAPTYQDTLKSGYKYTIYSAVDKRLALTETSSKTSSNIQISASNWGDNQIFTISQVSGEWYKIIAPSGKAVDAYGAVKVPGPGRNVYPNTYNGGDNQLWKFVKDGDGYRIQSKLGDFLDVASIGTASATNVQYYPESKKDAQLWYLENLTVIESENRDARFWDSESKPNMPLELPYATTPHSSTPRPLIYIRAGETITRTIQARGKVNGKNVNDILEVMWRKDISIDDKDAQTLYSAYRAGISIKTAPNGGYVKVGGINNVGAKQFTISADADASGFYVAYFVFTDKEPGTATGGVFGAGFYIYVEKAPAK